MNLNKIHSVYFIGIGGIGMSALARFFLHSKKNVWGYDRTETELTHRLSAEGAVIHYDENPGKIPAEIINNKEKSLIIYTPAIPETHKELDFFKSKGFSLFKRSEILGLITQKYKTIAVAGTHGKTSVSSMTAHILKSSGAACYAFLGGVLKDEQSNLLLPEKDNDEILAVVEADEYDRSFLTLQPYIALITTIDADHLDIYENEKNLRESFNQFADKIKQNGVLVLKKGLKITSRNDIKQYSYSIDEKADFYAQNITNTANKSTFDIVTPKEIIKNIEINIPGNLNVENVVAATAVATLHNINSKQIKEALKTWQGVKRRFEYVINTKDVIYIDDYAHHPEELKSFLTSIKNIYKDKHITGIFQPHLFTRTRDFAEEFAKSLNMLDSLFLLDIYPAREEPIKGISSELIFNKLSIKNKEIISKEGILQKIKDTKFEILLTIGAGDIDRLVDKIKEIINKKTNK